MNDSHRQTIRLTGLARLQQRLDPWLKGPVRSLARWIYRPLVRLRPVTLMVGAEPVRFRFGTQPPITNGRLVDEHLLFANAIRKGDSVVDVGAHHGTFTVLAGVCVGPTGWVTAFEPTDATRRILTSNIRINGYQDRTEIVPAAAGERAGTIDFFVRGDESTNRVFTPRETESGYTRQTVQLVRLDDFFANNRRQPNLLKIDVEGAEFAVLRGAERIVASDTRIFFEIHPYEWERAGHSANDLLDWLSAHGRSMVWLGTDEPVREFRYGNTELLRVT